MTSMLLTDRMVAPLAQDRRRTTEDEMSSVVRHPSSLSDLRRLVTRLGALRPAGVGTDVLLGLGFDQRHHLVLDRLDPLRGLGPLGAVPLRQVDPVVPVVIGARDVDRRREVFEPDLLP